MVAADCMVLLVRCSFQFLLRNAPRRIHAALPLTEQHWEGKVQEIGPDPLQLAVIMGVRVWCKPALSPRQAVELQQPWLPADQV